MVQVILLTGFLGAGKTTLLRRMLEARALGGPDRLGGDGRLALVVNELGEVGIDGALLPADRTRQVELPGGCVCCVLNEDLDRTILDLLAASPDVDTIVIETTGVAEPLPIAWSLGREPLASRVRLAAVVTVVDAVGFCGQRGVSPAVDAQVAYADVVVLSKTDLADDAQLAATRAEVARLAPRAPVVRGTPREVVAWLAEALADPERTLAAAAAARPAADHPPGGSHHGVASAWVPVPGPVDVEELTDALAELPARYVRIKGIVRNADDGGWAVVHRVGLRTSSEPLPPGPGEPGSPRLVALGHALSVEELAACVARAVVPSTGRSRP